MSSGLELDIASNVFGEFFKKAREYGSIRITPLANVDSIIASSILFKVLYENGFNVVVSLKPVLDYSEPTIFIDLDLCREDTLCLSILHSTSSTNTSSNKIVSPYSLSALVVKAIEKHWVIDSIDKVIALVGGVYRGLDLNKEGFKGLEASIVEELGREGRIVSDIGFRFWGWKRCSLVDSLVYTLRPYIPGVTGFRDRVYGLLEKIGVKEPDSISSGELISNPQLLKKLASEILGRLRSSSRRNRSPVEVIGRQYFTEIAGRYTSLLDLCIFYETLLSMGFNEAVSLVYSLYDTFYLEVLFYRFEDLLEKIVSEIASNIEQYRVYGGECVMEKGLLVRPDIYSRILRELGVLGDKPVYMKDSSGRLYTSLAEYIRVNARIDYSIVDENQFIEITR